MTTPVQNTPNRPRIALIAYEGVQMSAVLGVCDIIEVANRCACDLGDTVIACEVLRPLVPPDDTAFDAVVLSPNLSGARVHGCTGAG